jgi:hypothetical protein
MHPSMPKSEFSGQFRWGRVAAVKDKDHRLEVKFEEGEGFTSWDMPFLVQHPMDYSLPPVDAPVLCVIVDGALGVGFVLGCFFTDNDAPPLDDKGMRSLAGDDLRLGAHDASDKVALAPKCKGNFDDQKQHFDAVWNVITGSVINEPGNGGPSALQAALKIAIQAAPYPTPEDPAAENVSAK